MTKGNQLLRIMLLTILGTWFTYKLYQTAQNYFFLDAIVLCMIGSIGLLFFIWSIFKDNKEFKTSKKLTSYLSTIVGLLFMIANITLYHYQESKSNAPTLISGFNDGGFNGFMVDFKTDGNYVMANGSGLGQSFFYGTYSIRDSIITLDQSEIDNCIRTNKLVIRTENYYPKDSVDLVKSNANYITQIDSNGNEMDTEFRFRVTEDNRHTKHD